MPRLHLPHAFAAALVALLVLSGCRPGTALHSRYNNFRAYYNTYYNASRKLESGEEALRNADAVVDRARLVELFPTGSAGTSNPAFQETIDKSAELLRNRGDSKWADDALLLIGKAYFYQRNVVGAEQKFRETVEAAEAADNRRLADEARFWLGRTMAAADRYDDGVAVLQEALTASGGDRYWRARMTLALGELYARAARWDDAGATLREGVAAARDADLESRAYLLLGQVEEKAGRFEDAAEAYRRAAQVSRVYETTYAAQLSHALVLGLDVGRTDEALALIRAMARDDKNYARRAEVALVRARLLDAAGERDAALALYRDVLYERALAGQTVRGEAHMRLAEHYRDQRADFILASAHFDTAATALPAAVSAAQRPSRTAILGIRDLARTFKTVSQASQRIADLDSLLDLGSLDDEAFRQRIEALEAARYAVWLDEQRRADAVRAAQDFSGDAPGLGQRGATSGTPGMPEAGDLAGFLGFRDPTLVQSGQIAFQRVWGDRPLGLNWRRIAALQATQTAGDAGVNGPQVTRRTGLGPPPLDLSGVPRTPEAQRAVRVQRAELRYELGNAFFLSLNRLDLASSLYRQIVEETPDAPVARRAQYALAEVEAAAGRPDAARPLYEQLAASVEGVLGEASRARLEGREPDTTPAAVPDSSAVAYESAQGLWASGAPREAAAAFVALGETWPDAPVAPRAYLAGAYAFVSSVGTDTLALIAPLPPDMEAPRLRTGQPQAVDVARARQGAAAARSGEQAVQSDERAVVSDVRAPGGPPPVGAPRMVGEAPVIADPPSGSAGTDSVATVAPTTVLLADYLRALAARYPGSPSGARATALAAILPVPPPPPPDTTRAADPVPDSTEVVAVQPRAEPVPLDLTRLRSTVPLDSTLGGVTWRAQAYESQQEAEVIAGPLRAAGYRVAIASEDDTIVVVLGQFTDTDEAERYRTLLPAWIQVRGVVVPVETLVMLDLGRPPDDGKVDSGTEE